MIALAVTSLILALLGILATPFSLLAIIAEETFRYRNKKKHDNKAKGNILAKSALILSVLTIIVKTLIILQ